MSSSLKAGRFWKRSPEQIVKVQIKPDAKTGLEQNIKYEPLLTMSEPSEAEKEIYDLEWQIAEAQHKLAGRQEQTNLTDKIDHLKLTLQDLKDELNNV